MNNNYLIAKTIFALMREMPDIERHLSPQTIDFAHQYSTKKLYDFGQKERDPDEPNREEKMKAEAQLKKLIQAGLDKQRAETVNQLQRIDYEDINYEKIFNWGELEGQIALIITNGAGKEIEYFGSQIGFDIDWTGTNQKASEWASKYTAKLLKDIDSTTREVIASQVKMFIDTPGYTIGDVVDSLPFGERRSWTIAVTEITRAFAQASLIAGREAQKSFPDLKFYKRWYTNADEKVCTICGSFSTKFILLQDDFVTDGGAVSVEAPPAHPNCRCWMSTRSELGII